MRIFYLNNPHIQFAGFTGNVLRAGSPFSSQAVAFLPERGITASAHFSDNHRFGDYDNLYLYGVPLDLPDKKGYSEFDEKEGNIFLHVLDDSLKRGYENDELNFSALRVSEDYNKALGELMLAPFPASCYMVNKVGFSKTMARQKTEATERITTDEGNMLRQNRSIQVEGAFGVLKQNRDFRRFFVRSKEKTETQFFLLAFAFNIRKLWNRTLDNRLGVDLFQKEAA